MEDSEWARGTELQVPTASTSRLFITQQTVPTKSWTLGQVWGSNGDQNQQSHKLGFTRCQGVQEKAKALQSLGCSAEGNWLAAPGLPAEGPQTLGLSTSLALGPQSSGDARPPGALVQPLPPGQHQPQAR